MKGEQCVLCDSTIEIDNDDRLCLECLDGLDCDCNTKYAVALVVIITVALVLMSI